MEIIMASYQNAQAKMGFLISNSKTESTKQTATFKQTKSPPYARSF